MLAAHGRRSFWTAGLRFMTKMKTTLLAALASAFNIQVAVAQDLPQITTHPSFVAFQPFSGGNPFNDPHWTCHVGGYGGATFIIPYSDKPDAINSEGGPCYQLKPISGQSCDLIATVTVSSTYPQALTFWYSGVVATSEFFTAYMNGGASIGIHPTTNWQMYQFYVPAQTNGTATIRILFNQTVAGGYVDVDAFALNPIIPNPYAIDTNFTTTLTPLGVVMAWTRAAYTSNTLVWSSSLSGPFAPVSTVLTTNGGVVSASPQPATNDARYYRLRH